ncbi:hypothetical protein [uncultured Sneathiella sp.]|jgi:hypothetical protein|uniref:hypothetical protein n=1 Tax=uncultured Sneathiella sp. TaxID=879315 RepID=UPI0030D6F3D8|tara:strand:- start:2700 stop:3311 length:612 start_codon:yes stop_codon:yes gene_type:complete
MRPVTRSTFDIIHWLKTRTWASGQVSETPFLMKLLYLSQAIYAASHKQRKLMPSTFLATVSGPIEPDIFLALENNFMIREPLSPSTEVEKFLRSFYENFKDKGMIELDLILSQDTAIRSALARGRNGEIMLADMASAYRKGVPRLRESDGTSEPVQPYDENGRSDLDAAPNSAQEVRFTADGRSVTRWMPKRRIVSRERPILN